MSEQNNYEVAIQLVLDEAKKQGAVAAEAALGVETGLSVSVRLGDVETLEYNHDRGLGITVYVGQSKGSSSTSDLSEKALKDAVTAACGIARYTAKDEFGGLADKDKMAWDYPDLELNHPWNVTAEEAVEIALRCEQAARDFDKRISNSEGATVSSHQGVHYYGNSHGFIGHYPSTRHSLSCSVIGQDGGAMQRDYWYTVARNSANLDKAETVGKEAAERVIARLNGKSITTGKYPVLFSADVASGLVGHMIRAVRGGSLYRKTSFLLDSLGKQIFPDWVQINEVPHIKGGLGSSPFDSEGVVTRESSLITDGVLQRYVLDSYSARRLGMETTGNAGGVHNLIVSAGGSGVDDLVKHMHTGVLVTELMGQGINGVTGDYSRGAAGFWVENGVIQYPVEEITVASNLKDMYKNIVGIGKDVDLRRNVHVGSILIDSMTVAGS